jgi:hypothetical protein
LLLLKKALRQVHRKSLKYLCAPSSCILEFAKANYPSSVVQGFYMVPSPAGALHNKLAQLRYWDGLKHTLVFCSEAIAWVLIKTESKAIHKKVFSPVDLRD